MNPWNSLFSLGLIVLAAGVGGALVGDRMGAAPRVDDARESSAEPPWRLPRPVTPPDFQAQFDQLRARLAWGVDLEVAPAAPEAPEIVAVTVPEWRLVGLIREGERRLILYLDEAGQAHRASMGDRLPDGAVIVAIAEDHVALRREGERQVKWLHRRPEDALNPDEETTP